MNKKNYIKILLLIKLIIMIYSSNQAITAAGEFGQSLSQFLKKSSKFDSVALNEGITKKFHNYKEVCYFYY